MAVASILWRKARSGFIRARRIFISQRFGVPPTRIYSERFYVDAVNRLELPSASAVVDAICDFFSPSSIFDVGCGNGLYLHEAARRGIYATGCDGSEGGVRLCPPDVLVFLHDLRRPLIVNRRFDCCICFEVAEHIPKKYSEVLVDSCTRLSDLVLFSSSHPGQTGGEDHINLQVEQFWDRLFAKEAFVRDGRLTQSLRTRWRSNNVVGWLVENTRVYCRVAGGG